MYIPFSRNDVFSMKSEGSLNRVILYNPADRMAWHQGNA